MTQAAEKLYKQACLIERGSFRPLTKVNIDMLEKAKAQFIKREDVDQSRLRVFMELTLGALKDGGEVDHEDFIARIEVINACGYGVLVTNYFEYYRLSAYLRRLVREPVGLVLGLNNLADIFKEQYYENLDGGILEAFGVLFKENLRIYGYPIEQDTFEIYSKQMGRGDNVEAVADEDGLITIDNLIVCENLRNLYKYIRENGFLETIENCDRENMKLFSRDVFQKVCKREPGWQDPLPRPVVEMIEAKGLWQC